MDSPILFLIFDRPDTTQKVFESIKRQKPKQLFIAADGPRMNEPGEAIKCKQTREIINQIDWDCEVKTLFRDINLGCGVAVSSAITWFFENVNEGIILEDDCFPDHSFFRYCDELLSFYREDTSIMMISGNNFQGGIKRSEGSYYFSHYAHIWGWASWRRAWRCYDYNMEAFPAFLKDNKFNHIFSDKKQVRATIKTMSRAYKKYYNTWDYQWSFSIWEHNGMCIIPEVNLVTNIGFDSRGTHTNTSDTKSACIPTIPMKFPLIHPIHKEINKEADYYTFINVLFQPFFLKIKILLKRFLTRLSFFL